MLLHITWSSLVYFGSLVGNNSHEWWPIFLLYIRWPAGIVFEELAGQLSGIAATAKPDAHQYMLNDYIAGGLYIAGGAIWVWVVFFAIALLFFEESRA
jgi:hypothetical protein